MGKGKRLRGLRANTIAVEDEYKSINSMRDLGMKQYDIMPIGGKSRHQRRKEERERIANRDRVYHGPRVAVKDSGVTAARVLRKNIGEQNSINKARAIDFRARRATMEVQL